MGHGQPDWGGSAPLATVYSIQDLAELAARLNSIVTFDRRGNVIFLEDFEGSLSKCYHGTGGIGGSIAVNSERSRHGSFSCKMITGNAIDDYAYVGALVAYPVLSKMGIEICWTLPGTSNIKAIDLSLDLFDGTKDWYAFVQWVASSHTWQYHDGDGWISLSPTVNYYEGDTQFNHTKLVADFVNKEYVRLIANNQVYDLGGIALPSTPSADNPYLAGEVDTYTRVNAVCTVHLDSVIITQNEP